MIVYYKATSYLSFLTNRESLIPKMETFSTLEIYFKRERIACDFDWMYVISATGRASRMGSGLCLTHLQYRITRLSPHAGQTGRAPG